MFLLRHPVKLSFVFFVVKIMCIYTLIFNVSAVVVGAR